MTKNKSFWIALVAVMAVGPFAMAKTTADVQPVKPLPKASLLADNVVVSPSGTTQAAPAPAPAPVAVQPAPQQTYVQEPSRRSEVRADVSPPRNYAATIAVSALMGGVAGALIGGAIYYLGDQDQPRNIAYWAAGGVLVGTGVGLTQILVQESRASAAVANAQTDPAPTYRLALYHTRF